MFLLILSILVYFFYPFRFQFFLLKEIWFRTHTKIIKSTSTRTHIYMQKRTYKNKFIISHNMQMDPKDMCKNSNCISNICFCIYTWYQKKNANSAADSISMRTFLMKKKTEYSENFTIARQKYNKCQ